ncbi:hypothetical protein Bhyg_12193 [Pseudolycoriella hygida]|uniref:Uncharacterized protein n=1 Tax=Pseudolycoriella hygida TaxID=35572 RepID=A0A9Q0S0Y7_9DIPT|nr:hypothetical protein Bhyg_12193 [Pseudolycoriella hygida]
MQRAGNEKWVILIVHSYKWFSPRFHLKIGFEISDWHFDLPIMFELLSSTEVVFSIEICIFYIKRNVKTGHSGDSGQIWRCFCCLAGMGSVSSSTPSVVPVNKYNENKITRQNLNEVSIFWSTIPPLRRQMFGSKSFLQQPTTVFLHVMLLQKLQRILLPEIQTKRHLMAVFHYQKSSKCTQVNEFGSQVEIMNEHTSQIGFKSPKKLSDLFFSMSARSFVGTLLYKSSKQSWWFRIDMNITYKEFHLEHTFKRSALKRDEL